MKNDFLTIPDAPNYEINSDLIVRKKCTKRILKPKIRYGDSIYYDLFRNGKLSSVTAKSCWKKAKESLKSREKWVPVPSLKNKYEINECGELRNVRTKHTLRLDLGRCYKVFVEGRRKSVQLKNLLWETHGIICTQKKPVPVIAVNDKLAIRFDNLKKCAEYLAPKIHYAVKTILKNLSQRLAEFYGWHFFYQEEDLSKVKTSVTKVLKGYRK